MISCHITLNELPYDVADEILCVDEIRDDDSRWEIISTSPTHHSYKFTPKPNDSSWFVRWGFDYSWSNIRDAFLNQDQATQDWKNVGRVEHFRLPTVHYRFLGSPRPYLFSLDTLLVTEYIEGTRSLHNYFQDEANNRLAIEDTLIQYGELLSKVHEQGIVHNNFHLSNTIIQYNDATRLYITDWYDMQTNKSGGNTPYKKDLLTPIKDFMSIGYSQEEIMSFLNAYCVRMPWASEHIEDLYIQASKSKKR